MLLVGIFMVVEFEVVFVVFKIDTYLLNLMKVFARMTYELNIAFVAGEF